MSFKATEIVLYDIWGSRSGADGDSSLLWYDTLTVSFPDVSKDRNDLSSGSSNPRSSEAQEDWDSYTHPTTASRPRRHRIGGKYWYDIIYLLNAVGLPLGGSSTVHIYAQTTHRTIQNKQYIKQHNNLEECRPCPIFADFTLAFALQLRKKHGKTSVRVINYTY